MEPLDLQGQDSPRPPKRKRREKKTPAHSSIPHIDEKWLVSYSDMMTLLFGLFVMLFSIASESQGEKGAIEKTLKSISHQLSGTEGEVEAPVSEPPASVDAKKEPREIASVTETTPADQTDPAIPETPNQENEDLQKELSLAQQEKSSLESSLKEALEKQQALEEKLKNLSAKNDQSEKTLRKNEEKIRKEQDLLSSQHQKVLEEQEQLKKELSQFQEQLKVAQTEKQKLERDIASFGAQDKMILVQLNWAHDKYDLDMEMTDPAQKIYTFKNRSQEGTKTKFLAESTKGPGSEILMIDPSLEGKYAIKVEVYNSRGAKDGVNSTLTATTPFGEVILAKPSFDSNRRFTTVYFEIKKDGSLSVLPSK